MFGESNSLYSPFAPVHLVARANITLQAHGTWCALVSFCQAVHLSIFVTWRVPAVASTWSRNHIYLVNGQLDTTDQQWITSVAAGPCSVKQLVLHSCSRGSRVPVCVHIILDTGGQHSLCLHWKSSCGFHALSCTCATSGGLFVGVAL